MREKGEGAHPIRNGGALSRMLLMRRRARNGGRFWSKFVHFWVKFGQIRRKTALNSSQNASKKDEPKKDAFLVPLGGRLKPPLSRLGEVLGRAWGF